MNGNGNNQLRETALALEFSQQSALPGSYIVYAMVKKYKKRIDLRIL